MTDNDKPLSTEDQSFLDSFPDVTWEEALGKVDGFTKPVHRSLKDEINGILFVNGDGRKLDEDIQELEHYIVTQAAYKDEELRKTGKFTEKQMGGIYKSLAVVDPATLSMALLQMNHRQTRKMTDAEKERIFLARFPGRFRARFKENENDRNQRELTPEEDNTTPTAAAECDTESNAERMARRRNMSFTEFLREIGKELQAEKAKCQRQA